MDDRKVFAAEPILARTNPWVSGDEEVRSALKTQGGNELPHNSHIYIIASNSSTSGGGLNESCPQRSKGEPQDDAQTVMLSDIGR